jgi:hypothetical protein
MAKSWMCRLRLHKWDDRENPETHAQYQVVCAVTHTETGTQLLRARVQQE